MDDLELYGNNAIVLNNVLSNIVIVLEYIYMHFDTNKCAHIEAKAEKVSVGGMELLSGEVMPELESYKVYKYLETNDIIQTEMKDKIPKKYYTRVRQLKSSKLNTIKATNIRVVLLVRYSAGILNWRTDELKVKEKTTKKVMTVNRICTISRVILTDCTFQEWKVEKASTKFQIVHKLKNRIFSEYKGPISTAKKQKKEEIRRQQTEKQLLGKAV